MRRGIFALLAIIGMITPCCGAMVYYAGSTAAFDAAHQASAAGGNPLWGSAGDAAITMEMADPGVVVPHATRDKVPAWVLDFPAASGPKNGELFAYGLVLVASRVQGPAEIGGEASELTTLLMIGAGLMAVGFARRYVKPA
jgi:hypothetical protein